MAQHKRPRRRHHRKGRKGRGKIGAMKKFVKREEFTNITTVKLLKGVEQMFPDRMFVKLRDEINITWSISSGTAIQAFAILGNGLHLSISGTPDSGANPVTVGTGSGIYGLGNLLGGNSTFNSTGPYNQYRIHSTGIYCEHQMSGGSSTTSSSYLAIVPMTTQSMADLGNVNTFNVLTFAEMPYSKTMNLAGLTTNKGIRWRQSMSTAKMFGLKYRASLENAEYSGEYGANPTNTWAWVFVNYVGESASIPSNTLIKIEYWIEFYDRNLLAVTSG